MIETYVSATELCSPDSVSNDQLQQLWNSNSQSMPGHGAGFAQAFRLAHSAAIWGTPSVRVRTPHDSLVAGP